MKPPMKQSMSRWYCWWKKSCTSCYGWYPIFHRVLSISGGAEFLPSTVCTKSQRGFNSHLFNWPNAHTSLYLHWLQSTKARAKPWSSIVMKCVRYCLWRPHGITGHHTSTAVIGMSNPTFSHQATQFHQLSSTSDRFEKSNSAEWLSIVLLSPQRCSATWFKQSSVMKIELLGHISLLRQTFSRIELYRPFVTSKLNWKNNFLRKKHIIESYSASLTFMWTQMNSLSQRPPYDVPGFPNVHPGSELNRPGSQLRSGSSCSGLLSVDEY